MLVEGRSSKKIHNSTSPVPVKRSRRRKGEPKKCKSRWNDSDNDIDKSPDKTKPEPGSKSPESPCSICLGEKENKSFTDRYDQQIL